MQTFQEKHLDPKESYIWQISDERVKNEDHLLCGEQKSTIKPPGFGSTAYTEQHDRVLCDHSSHNPPAILGVCWWGFFLFSDFQNY